MNTIKQNFNDLWNNEKPVFYFIVIRLSIGFLFFLSMLLPYAKGSALIDGRVSLVALDGGGVFAFLIFVTILLNAFFAVLKNNKLEKIIYLVQSILATIIVLYGVLVYVVGFEEVASNISHGFGYTLGLISFLLMWVLFIKTTFFFELFKKLVFKGEIAPEQPESQEQPIQD